MRTVSATEASRGFSHLLDAIEGGETVTVTRAGHVVAEIRPARAKTGRDLRLALEARAPGTGLNDEDADEMLREIATTTDDLHEEQEDPWGDG